MKTKIKSKFAKMNINAKIEYKASLKGSAEFPLPMCLLYRLKPLNNK